MKILILLFIFLMTTNIFAQKEILGNWLSSKKTAKIQVYENKGKYYGKIIWLKEPNTSDNKPKKDIENPDEKLRNRPLLGLNILWNFTFDGENEWSDGEIYDPKNGKTYSCNMKLKGNKLEIRGYIGISLFGRTEYGKERISWGRGSGDWGRGSGVGDLKVETQNPIPYT
ncbi:MAG: hypothetical protein HW421_3964 [Ignavibacteria bacterium]|nr:hypothetical protein [Ignavibacteria bacterium]